jgi:choline dehydrogenase
MSKRWANSTPDDDPAGKRAKNGPVDISYVNWVLPFTTWAKRATEALGMKSIPGFIDGDLIGTSWAVRTADAKTQVRESSETAYLRPALKRPNLIVYHSTMATRILFNDTVASGILCNSLGKNYGLSARKEVILSAGAFGSAQLLMVSGIDPREILGKVGVPVLVDAPGVGQAMEVCY